MYNNGLFASPAEIMADGQKMVQFASSLDAELNSFSQNVEGLLEIWHGDSAQSFASVFAEEKATLKNFQQMLDSKGNALMQASTILSDTEAQNTANASKLGN